MGMLHYKISKKKKMYSSMGKYYRFRTSGDKIISSIPSGVPWESGGLQRANDDEELKVIFFEYGL